MAHETAGAASTRSSLRPLNERAGSWWQTSGSSCREIANAHSVVIVREGGRSSIPETSMTELIGRSLLDIPPSRGMTAVGAEHHTGSAIEYFTWLSAKLDSIEAMPSSR